MSKKQCIGVLAIILVTFCLPLQAGLFDSLKSAVAGSSDESSGKSADERALELYRSGKKKFERGDFEGARADLSKALSLNGSDGAIKIVKDQQVEWVETPRGLERRVVSDSTSYEYLPHQYLRRVETELDKIAAADQKRWQEQQQNAAAQDELRKKFSNPPQLSLTYDFIDDNRDGVLSAKETGKLVVTLENTGGYRASDVELKIRSSAAALTLGGDSARNIKIGEIAPGQSMVETFDIAASDQVGSGREHLLVQASERDGFGTGEESKFAISTQEYRPALFEIVDQRVVHLRGNIYQVDYTVLNRGKGPAGKAVVQVRPDSSNIYVLDNNRVEIGTLAVNASQSVSFTFSKNNRVKAGDPLPLSVRAIDESDEATGKEFALALALPSGGGGPGYSVASNYQPGAAAAGPVVKVENVALDIPEGRDQKPYGRAFIIGNSRYAHLDPVAYALNDARVMKDYAQKTLGFKRVTHLEDQNSYDLRDVFGTKARQFKDGKLYSMVERDSSRQPNPPVFIYYSGHGAPGLSDGKAYLVPVDAQMNRLDQQGYPLEDLYAAIKALPTNNVTLVLDSCFSGNTDTVAGSQTKALYTGVSPAAFKTNELKPENVSNLTLFTSAAASEVSYWHAEARHGLFTYNFLRALRGAADKQGDNDGVVTAGEIQSFVEYEVAEYIDISGKGSRQTPGLAGIANRPIAKIR